MSMPADAVPSRDLFRDENILTQICGNGFMVLKAASPLVVTLARPDELVAADSEVVELALTFARFPSEALGTARRAAVN